METRDSKFQFTVDGVLEYVVRYTLYVLCMSFKVDKMNTESDFE